MGLVKAKMKILETLSVQGTPMRSEDVAKKIGLSVATATTHLLDLRKSGHVYTPEHGFYTITELGRQAIAIGYAIARAGANVHADKILSKARKGDFGRVLANADRVLMRALL